MNFLVPYRELFSPLLVDLNAWLRRFRSPKYLKYLEVFKSIYSAREACVCVLLVNNHKRPWGEPLPKPHNKPWSLYSLKRCGCATFHSGFACAPLACPSALRLRGSEEPQLKLRWAIAIHRQRHVA
ncbi:hypothetical protein EFO83_03070 [Lacticaseibacillus rhamnosus]|nr:hypothetical protein [Lacticaseibacillus rhamnosus]MCT3318970.1 hypothetical protein [Lacticaseibacillus paracasei]MCT3372420.1 hypothetical protein [Lacticaseibacillus rhamnosus]MED7649647.1 hypothetical protein [Lacticaseibacillus paracasei]TXJ63402.1 hypothetical protein FGO89_16505 [Lacticaseibacillus paracasei]